MAIVGATQTVWTQDPDEDLDYGTDLTAELTALADTIDASTWSFTGPDTELELHAETFDDFTATIWIRGGTLGAEYLVTNHIVTAAGRKYDRSRVMWIETR